jgi:hypothetical protein
VVVVVVTAAGAGVVVAAVVELLVGVCCGRSEQGMHEMELYAHDALVEDEATQNDHKLTDF